MKGQIEWGASVSEIRKGSVKYVEAMIKVLEKMDEGDMMELGKNMVYIGYAAGVVAGKCSDIGIEGFTCLLEGIKVSLLGEDRDEKMQYAVWDRNGDLHTSEESGFEKEGGQA